MTLRALWARIRGTFGSPTARLDEEVRLHLELLADENIRRGMSPADARQAARRTFGGVSQVREAYRDQMGWRALDALVQDVRYALRGFLKAPGFALTAVFVLAIGIGATSSMFTLINALLLRELPVERPEQLVDISAAGGDGEPRPLTVATLRELERSQRSFSDLIGWDGTAVVTVGHRGRLMVANFWAVTGNFHRQLGAAPFLGRTLTDDDVKSAAPVVVVGYPFWQRSLDGDRTAVGQFLDVEGTRFTIVGVTQPYFTGLWVGQAPDVTIPLSSRVLTGRGPANDLVASVQITGRLGPGSTVETARAEIDAIWPGLRQATMPPALQGARRDAFLAARPRVESVAKGHEDFLRPRFARPLYLLMGIAAVMLLIACMHLAHLLLARAWRHEGELSVRAALGASRARLVQQVAVESLLLSACGAAVGLLAAGPASAALARLMTQQFLTPATFDFRPDAAVVAATIAASVLTALLFAAAPAWFSARREPAGVLQQTARGLASRAGRGGRMLLAMQVALTTVLLAVAALLVRSLGAAHAIDPGFDRDGVLQAQLMRRPRLAPNTETREYQHQLIDRVSALDGVRAASLSAARTGRAESSGYPVSTPSGTGLNASRIQVSPGYFATVGLDLLAGRDFDWNDWNDASDRDVAILSRSLADRLFPGSNGLGNTIRDGTSETSRTVVGIVEDGRLDDVRSAGWGMYVPLGPQRQTSFLHVRTPDDSETLRAAMAREVEALGRQYVHRTNTTREIVDQRLVDVRLAGLVAQFFAAASLVLVCIGLYGVLAYTIAARTREIGLRLALGAGRRRVLLEMLGFGLLPVASGVSIGVPAAIAATGSLRSLLFGLEPYDPATLFAVVALLIGVATVAAYLPARRASRLEPMAALRGN